MGLNKNLSKISLAFFLIISLLGTSIRAAAYLPLPFVYGNLIHAHSHIAFQGWVYTIIFLLLYSNFVSTENIKKGKYLVQFYLTMFTLIGVLISFSLQGYGLYSIAFSTLFQVLNYWFIFRFLKDFKSQKGTLHYKFITTGMFLGILSTLMPIIIGVLSAKGFNETEVYKSAVYTFLHLQYNAWFLFVALGLLFHFLEKQNITYNKKYSLYFYYAMTLAVLPAISLSLLGMSFANSFILLAYFSAITTFIALVFFVKSFSLKTIDSFKTYSAVFKLYFTVFIIAFILKLLLQSISVLPLFNDLAFANKSIILAYLHLSLIGVISFLFLALLVEKKWLPNNKLVKLGSLFLVIGFISTELSLILSGFQLFHNQIILILGSLLMVVGIFLQLISKTSIK